MGFVSHASAATEFVSIVDTGNGTGTDYTSLSAWETGVQTDLTAATTLVFAGAKTGTMADNASVTGSISLATATVVHATDTQILLESISGTFQNGEQIQIDGSNYFTTSNTGDSAIAVAKCRASTGAADTAAVTITGWTTSATNYIKIWTDPTEGYRHDGKWDDRKYRLSHSDNTTGLTISEDYVKVDGLQIHQTTPPSSSFAYNIWQTSGGGSAISNSILRGPIATSSIYHGGMRITSSDTKNNYFYNNIIYDYLGDYGYAIALANANSTWYVFNNTAYDCHQTFWNANSGKFHLYNNISQSSTLGYSGSVDSADYNISDISSDAPGSHSITGTTTFISTSTDDFHLAQSDTGAKNAGTDLSADPNLPFSTDIDGSTRTGTWDIGADEAAIPVFYSVGQNTNDHKTSGSYVQDNFNRPDANPIGGNWSAITSEDPFRIVSNQMVATVTDSNGVYWNANAFDNDQYSQVTLKTAGGTYIGAMVRISSSAKTYYFFGSGATSSYVLGKYVSGSWTVINTYTETQAVNDVIKLRVVGTTLTPTLNGTDLQSFADSSISSGSPGIHTYGSTSAALDDWEGGNLGGSLIAPIMSISSGVGTFSVAQTATNMGVGDKVTYDTSTVAYISEKISSTQWKLITATGGTPANITDSAVVSIAHPFASLSAALPSSPGGSKGASYLNTADLVTGNYQLNIPCYYDTASDTTAVTINGWITGSANYIKVYTPSNTTIEVNQSQRHSGKWDEGKYRMEYSGAPGITIQTDDVRIDGLQLYLTSGGQNDGGIFTRNSNANSDFRFSNNIIKAPGNLGAWWMDGIQIYLSGSGNVYIWNNIIYGFGPNTNDNGILIDDSDFTAYIYNNTIYNCTNGIYRYSGTAVTKNNIAYNNSDNYLYYSTPFDASSTNNLSGPTQTDAPGSNPQNSKTITFADEANDDFHLVLEDAGARSYGVNLFADAYLPVKDDIDGQTRGEPWDIGADQYQGTVANSERNLPASLESGLIGYWSFDSPDTTWSSDTAGTTNDLSSNSYDGTLTNMLKVSSPIGGISRQGFDFRGQDANADNVSVTHSTAFDSADITYSAWIKPDTISNWDAITEVTPTQDYFGLYNGQYSIWGRCGNIYLGHTIKRNQWAFVAYVISGENYSLYEDGELIASGSGCSTSTTNHGLLKIGARSDDSMGFDGVIDEVRVYSRALSIDEVIQLYKLNAGKGKPNSVLSKTAGLSSGLVGHWSFNGPDTAWTSSTAGTTNDLSGNGHTGTLTNMSRSASPALGKLGQALKFDGVDDYVDAGDINAIDGISQMTISAWFYRDTQNDNIALEKGVSNINRIGINSNNTIYFNVGNGENAAGYTTNNKVGWFHVAMVFDGTQTGNPDRLKGYLDGVQQTLSWWSSYTIPDTAPSNSASFQIGHSVGNAMYAKGKFDDVRVYDRVLSAGEVADLYQTSQMKILK
ncbi:MAG TPA: hypothetical protein P5099_01885 [Candidatus Moranbacteria bacterium]|nr:hypothetical protein [Candidatus Moranbacteria bacterium]